MKKYVWLTYDNTKKKEYYKRLREKIFKAGLNGIMLNNTTDNSVISFFKSIGIEVHIWFIALLNKNENLQKEHPEWFMVNGYDKSSLKNPAYVDYYKWLCPSRLEVRNYLKTGVNRLLEKNIDGLHLDYIRYPDVFLPSELQKKYGITQNEVKPEYDYCYCEKCRSEFQEKFGKDPLKEIEKKFQKRDWLNYRLKKVNSLVKEIAEDCRKKTKRISAAVFPNPEMARKSVRQEWDKWKLDAYFPMLYHNFYGENIDWIGKQVDKCRDMVDQDAYIVAGVFMESVESQELKSIAEKVLENNGKGLCFFDAESIKDSQWQAIKEMGK